MMHNPPHPGESIRDLCIEPPGMTIGAAAEHLGVSRKHLSAVINGKAAISAEMAVRLAMAFGGSAETWMRQQVAYDLWRVAESGRVDVRPVRRAACPVRRHRSWGSEEPT